MEISPVVVRIDPTDFLCLILKQSMGTKNWLPNKSNKGSYPFFVDKQVRINGPRCHHSVASNNTIIRHDPENLMKTFRVIGDIIPKSVVCSTSCWHIITYVIKICVHCIRKLHRVVINEYRVINRCQIVISFFRIKLGAPATHIPCRILGPASSLYGRETVKYRSLFSSFL